MSLVDHPVGQRPCPVELPCMTCWTSRWRYNHLASDSLMSCNLLSPPLLDTPGHWFVLDGVSLSTPAFLVWIQSGGDFPGGFPPRRPPTHCHQATNSSPTGVIAVHLIHILRVSEEVDERCFDLFHLFAQTYEHNRETKGFFCYQQIDQYEGRQISLWITTHFRLMSNKPASKGQKNIQCV